jgi:hypothetical protein
MKNVCRRLPAATVSRNLTAAARNGGVSREQTAPPWRHNSITVNGPVMALGGRIAPQVIGPVRVEKPFGARWRPRGPVKPAGAVALGGSGKLIRVPEGPLDEA